MRIRVLHDYDYTPAEDPRLTVAFKAGAEVTTKRAWGEAAVAAGKAEEVVTHSRDSDATDKAD